MSLRTSVFPRTFVSVWEGLVVTTTGERPSGRPRGPGREEAAALFSVSLTVTCAFVFSSCCGASRPQACPTRDWGSLSHSCPDSSLLDILLSSCWIQLLYNGFPRSPWCWDIKTFMAEGEPSCSECTYQSVTTGAGTQPWADKRRQRQRVRSPPTQEASPGAGASVLTRASCLPVLHSLFV